MKKLFLCSILFLLVMSGMTQATMLTIGTAIYNGSQYNLIWDDDNNGNSVIWLDYTNYKDSWDDQVSWAASLNGTDVLTYNIDSAYTVDWGTNVWRLPITVDGLYEYGYDGTTTAGQNITSSEMGHLYYEELGNLGMYGTSGEDEYQPGWGLTETGDFENLVASVYWSGTEYANVPSNAWHFTMEDGDQYRNDKSNSHYGLAIHTAQVSTVPEPGTFLLLGAGILGGLAAAGRKKGIH